MESRRAVRRRVPIEHDAANSVDRWMVSYADFITLLFAMFVVLYGISQVSETKYRVLADAFRSNFTGAAQPYPARPTANVESPGSNLGSSQLWASLFRELTLEPEASGSASVDALPFADTPIVQPTVNEVVVNETAAEVELDPVPTPTPTPTTAPTQPPPAETLARVEEELRSALGERIGEQGILLRQSYKGLEIELNTELLFPSASERLNASVRPVLSDVARVLAGIDNSIDVEGFADDLPILTPRFYSNWELAGARAAAVVRLLIEENVAPQRLAAVSYGEFRPVVSNQTDAGRARNRRVVLVVREYSRELPEGQIPAG